MDNKTCIEQIKQVAAHNEKLAQLEDHKELCEKDRAELRESIEGLEKWKEEQRIIKETEKRVRKLHVTLAISAWTGFAGAIYYTGQFLINHLDAIVTFMRSLKPPE